MTVFKKYTMFQRLIGLDPLGGIENFILPTIYLTIFISSEMMAFIFFISNNRKDVQQVDAALTAILGIMPVAAIYSHLLICRNRFYSLLDELQEIEIESTKVLYIFWNIETMIAKL